MYTCKLLEKGVMG